MKYNPEDAVNLIPDGDYEASIKAVYDENREGQPIADKSGNPGEMIAFEVYVDGGARTLHETFYSGPKSLWRYAMLASALGESDAFKAAKFNASNHIGTNLNLTLGSREYQGRSYQQIKDFNPSKVGAAAPSTVTAGDVAKAVGGKTIEHEDIPF